MLTAQFTSFQTVGDDDLANGADHAASTLDGRRSSGRTGADGLLHDEQAALTETYTPGLPYHIETTDGRVFSGRVGQDGKLPRIETYGEDQYTLHIGEEALLKQEGEAP